LSTVCQRTQPDGAIRGATLADRVFANPLLIGHYLLRPNTRHHGAFLWVPYAPSVILVSACEF
jgi:hypothetical protein